VAREVPKAVEVANSERVADAVHFGVRVLVQHRGQIGHFVVVRNLALIY
jgi:hypothetical protein